jgi:phospholipase C
MKSILKTSTALVATLGLLQSSFVNVAHAQAVIAQPNPGGDVATYFIDPATDPTPSNFELIQLLRQRVKYVFVIFNENHSFDNEYGTFPGVNGIYSDGQNPRSAANTPGFTQTYVDLNGNTVTVQPFLIGPQQNATFVDSVDHSHTGLARKLDVVNGVPQMDQFSYDEYYNHAKAGNNASQAQGTQFARLVMSHIDCNTIPFFWQYASRFTIFDNIFATEDTPSAPNAIAMIAGQSGETQWVKHGANGFSGPISGTINGNPASNYPNPSTTQGPPIVGDAQPYWGSYFDTTVTNRQPTGPNENWTPSNTASNLTFATVPLTMMGSNITSITDQDYNATLDLPDIKNDIPYIHELNHPQVNWRWYQNGYDAEPTDPASTTTPLHENFVSHHEGPQYFGYLANNPAERGNFRGENDFFTDMQNNTLPNGGVFYIRGGYYNLNYPTVTPPIQNKNYPPETSSNTPPGLTASDITAINTAKSGDDDHPSYSDRQIEAMNARVINAIASNESIWNQSVIIITYDESDGFYDHVPPRILSYGPPARST